MCYHGHCQPVAIETHDNFFQSSYMCMNTISQKQWQIKPNIYIT